MPPSPVSRIAPGVISREGESIAMLADRQPPGPGDLGRVFFSVIIHIEKCHGAVSGWTKVC